MAKKIYIDRPSEKIKENFTQVPNGIWRYHELCDAAAWNVLCVIIQKLYRFHKDEDEIPMKQFKEITRLSRPKITEKIQALEEANFIRVKRKRHKNSRYSLVYGWKTV